MYNVCMNNLIPQRIRASVIVTNPYQYRSEEEFGALANLAASIQRHGLLSPILVSRSGEGYVLIAGERRLRAMRDVLGWEEVPAFVLEDVDEAEMEALALVENEQREGINSIGKLVRAISYLSRVRRTSEESVLKAILKNALSEEEIQIFRGLGFENVGTVRNYAQALFKVIESSPQAGWILVRRLRPGPYFLHKWAAVAHGARKIRKKKVTVILQGIEADIAVDKLPLDDPRIPPALREWLIFEKKVERLEFKSLKKVEEELRRLAELLEPEVRKAGLTFRSPFRERPEKEEEVKEPRQETPPAWKEVKELEELMYELQRLSKSVKAFVETAGGQRHEAVLEQARRLARVLRKADLEVLRASMQEVTYEEGIRRGGEPEGPGRGAGPDGADRPAAGSARLDAQDGRGGGGGSGL